MFLLLHAFYASALVGLVFPLTALDIRFTCFLLLDAPY
jgi:hypothetical protein